MWDAQAIPAPTNIPPLPSGTFYFPLGPAEKATRGCLAPTLESNAWSCSVPNHVLNIEFAQTGNYPLAKIYPAPQALGSEGVHYGPQPPRVQPQQKLIWVNDLSDPTRGPALHFQTVYDKIVVIPAENFPMTNFKKRSAEHEKEFFTPGRDNTTHDNQTGDKGAHVILDTQSEEKHRYANSPGEEPWYCYWNATFIEGFVYVQEPIPGAETQTFAKSRYTPSHTEYLTSKSQKAPATPTPTATTVSFPDPPGQQLVRTLTRRSPAKPSSSRSSSTTPVPEPNQSSIPTPTSPPTRFPYVIKMEERRLPDSAFHPFCQRMVAQPDGSLSPKLDENGKLMIEYLKEAPGGQKDAQVTAGVSPSGSGHQRKEHITAEGSIGHKKRLVGKSVDDDSQEASVDQAVAKSRDEPPNSCHCMWLSPMG
jgi:hypothetical protein